MPILRTAIFFLGWIVGTLAIGFLGLPALISRRATWRLSSFWAAFTLGWLRMSCGIRSEWQGTPATQLIASKHQSAWDTLMLWRILGNPAFVLKRELYYIPIFGWYLWRCGHIAINRKTGREAYELMKNLASQVLAEGRHLIIFPEGTRVRIGDRKPYRGGIARISALLQIGVTPVALNAGLYWPKHTLIKTPGTARLEFLPPMPISPPESGAWMQQLENEIETATARLAARAE